MLLFKMGDECNILAVKVNSRSLLTEKDIELQGLLYHLILVFASRTNLPVENMLFN
jgi:hypothetical protein